jgi:hypothetical protein
MPGEFFIKQGGLLQLSMQVQQDDATPVDITGYNFFSEIRDTLGGLVATPVLTVTNAALGQLTYSAQSDTTWPTGRLKSDLYVNSGSVPFYTQTFFVLVQAPVTVLADHV